jgi:hypothetical protein
MKLNLAIASRIPTASSFFTGNQRYEYDMCSGVGLRLTQRRAQLNPLGRRG